MKIAKGIAMSDREWFSISELEGLPGLKKSRKQIYNRAQKEGWVSQPRKEQGGGREYHLNSLPGPTQAYLTGHVSADIKSEIQREEEGGDAPRSDAEAAWARWEHLPKGDRERAQQRLRILQAYERLQEQGNNKQQIEADLRIAYNVSGATVRRLWKLVKGANRQDWLALLATQYKGKQPSAEFTEAAWRHFVSIYLKMEAPSLSICHEQTERVAKENGWSWPTERTVRRRVEREIPWQVVVLEREGADALRQRLPMQERDRSALRAMEALNTDGHVFDWWVTWPDGEQRRPVVVAWQDLFSNYMLSWRVDKTENADGVRLSFSDAIQAYGLPDEVYQDNGFGYAGKVMSGGTPTRFRGKVTDDEPLGVFAQLNIRVHWVLPGRGSSKPIERMWRELEDRLRARPELNGAWAGNAPGVKPPEYKPGAVDLETFLTVVDDEIRAYNERQGRTTQNARGRSFAETFRESYEQAVVAKPTAEQVRICLLSAESVRVQKRDASIRLVTGGNRYWDEALGPHAGKRVTVRFDPQQMHEQVHVYTQEGRYICAAECVQRIGFNDSQAAREQARLYSQHRRAARKAADALGRIKANDAARNIPDSQPDPEPIEPAATRLVRPVRTQGSAALQTEEEFQASADQSAFEEDFQGATSLLEERLKRRGKSQL